MSQRRCTYCQSSFSTPQGVSNHERACKKKNIDEVHRRSSTSDHIGSGSNISNTHSQRVQENTELLRTLEAERETRRRDVLVPIDIAQESRIQSQVISKTPSTQKPSSHAPNRARENLDETPPVVYEEDDIRTEYHPRAKKPVEVTHFDDYRSATRPVDTPIDQKPWSPFASLFEFEAADFALDARLNQPEVNRFYSLLLRRQGNGDEALAIKNWKEWTSAWESASHRRAEFMHVTFDVPVNDKVSYEYTMYYRPLWHWFQELLDDPTIAPHFVWDAQKLYKYDSNSEEFRRFIHEPWTADDFWIAQSSLPNDAGKPLAFILYADKTRLSSFGTVQGYPVVVRCANLPVEIRNGNGIGGGRIVGWLPIPEDDPRFSDTVLATHKRVVWHKAMSFLLGSITEDVQIGRFWKTLHGDILHLFPTLLILSADYEEQSMMSLNRGVRGLYPCNTCLVPNARQIKMNERYAMRTTDGAKDTFARAMGAKNGEDILKAESLRPIENCFWQLPRFDVYKALSFDRLHAFHDGLWGKHQLPHLITRIQALEKETVGVKKGVLSKLADTQMALFPRWRNLSYFKGFMTIRFTDGGKFEDLSKQILFCVHNILTREDDPDGYLFLQCIRSYIALDMYAELWVHTEDTLAAGRREQDKFSKLMQKYDEVCQRKGDAHRWNFPKMHSHVHLFDDILAKGVTRNTNTKPNEKMHGPLKKSYQLQTNFKETDGQILRLDHWFNTSSFIRQQIDLHNEQVAEQKRLKTSDYEEDSESETEDEAGHVTAHGLKGRGGGVLTLATLEDRKEHDPAYKHFTVKLGSFVKGFMESHPALFPKGSRSFTGLRKETQTVQLYGSLKVHYENKVDWKETVDYLKCSPLFYRHPRYDCVIINSDDGQYFARLVAVFHIDVGIQRLRLALIHPYSQTPRNDARRDQDLGFYRVRSKRRTDTVIVPIDCIIRGAVLVPDFSRYPIPPQLLAAESKKERVKLMDELYISGMEAERDYVIVDCVDADMFLRMQELSYVGKPASR